MVQAYHQVEAPLVLKHHTCSLAGVCRTDDRVQLFNVNAITGYLVAVEVYHQLWQSDRLFYNHVGSTGHLIYI